MIRFYEGLVYDVWLAVWPTQKGVNYYILHQRGLGGREAYIKCGFDRTLWVNEHAKLILERDKKRKIISLPFVKEEGCLVCNLPEFLKKQGVHYQVYKCPKRNCKGYAWNSISYSECVCKNGELCWGSDMHIDWREYWLGIYYNAGFPIFNGKKVSRIQFWSEGQQAEEKQTLEWFKSTIVEQVTMSWKEFGQKLDTLGLRKESPFLEITFCDGTMLKGDRVDW